MSNNLIEKFVNASIKYGEAQEKGDYKECNKQNAIVKKIRLKLKGDKDGIIDIMVPLLNHENGHVRYKAAFTLLPIFEDKAIETFNDLCSNKGLLAFEARTTIEQWQKGNIIVYWL